MPLWLEVCVQFVVCGWKSELERRGCLGKSLLFSWDNAATRVSGSQEMLRDIDMSLKADSIIIFFMLGQPCPEPVYSTVVNLYVI